MLPYKRQLYCCHASIGCTSFVSIVSVTCGLNARQFMNWKKKGITFHLPFKKCPGKGRGKRAHINPLEAQKHKLSFVSCLSSQIAGYQLVRLLNLQIWKKFRINSINYIIILILQKLMGTKLIEIWFIFISNLRKPYQGDSLYFCKAIHYKQHIQF